jgi:hypothetical protein
MPLSRLAVCLFAAVLLATACGEESPPSDPLHTVTLHITNRSSATATATYALVVTAPDGRTRSEASRWGTMTLDVGGGAFIPEPAEAREGDRLEATLNVSAGSASMGLDVRGPVACTGFLDDTLGAVAPSVACE